MSGHSVSRWSLAWGDVAYYSRYRRWSGLARSVWGRLVENDEGERCELCGRDYVLWHAEDDLYQAVVGDCGGTFCPACFDRLSKDGGMPLHWEPSREAKAEQSDPMIFDADDFYRQQFMASIGRRAEEWRLPVRCPKHDAMVVETRGEPNEPLMEFVYDCGCKLDSRSYQPQRERGL